MKSKITITLITCFGLLACKDNRIKTDSEVVEIENELMLESADLARMQDRIYLPICVINNNHYLEYNYDDKVIELTDRSVTLNGSTYELSHPAYESDTLIYHFADYYDDGILKVALVDTLNNLLKISFNYPKGFLNKEYLVIDSENLDTDVITARPQKDKYSIYPMSWVYHQPIRYIRDKYKGNNTAIIGNSMIRNIDDFIKYKHEDEDINSQMFIDVEYETVKIRIGFVETPVNYAQGGTILDMYIFELQPNGEYAVTVDTSIDMFGAREINYYVTTTGDKLYVTIVNFSRKDMKEVVEMQWEYSRNENDWRFVTCKHMGPEADVEFSKWLKNQYTVAPLATPEPPEYSDIPDSDEG